MRAISFLFSLLMPTAAMAAQPPASPYAFCETAIAGAEFAARLPPRLLGAIAGQESGRYDEATGSVRPWPWTINANGDGQFFATKEQAIKAVQALQAHAVRSIDVGCLQVNLMYHPDAFATLEEAFDPSRNAAFAARFLNSLYSGSHRWQEAIAAYHSETPALGDAYRAMVVARWQRPGPAPVAEQPQSPYQDFTDPAQVYAAFAPRDRAYGAFAPPHR